MARKKGTAPTEHGNQAREKKPRQRYSVDAPTFIKIWQTSNSVNEVSERTGIPAPICHARASSYRAAGVQIKSMPRGGRAGLDVGKLNELIATLKAEKEAVSHPALEGTMSYAVKQLVQAM